MNVLDRDVEAQAFHQLHRAACAKLLVAVLSYGLTLLLLYGALGVTNGWMYGVFLLALGALFFTYRARHFWQITWSGRVILVLCAGGFAQGAMYLASPVFWFLPIGLSLTLPIAASYLHARDYIVTGSLIWVAVWLVMMPHFATPMEAWLALLTVVGSMSAGMLTSVAFCRLRTESFALQQQLLKIAYVDALTGLPNRRAIMQELPRLMLSPRPDASLYFLMLDIDNFKSINDRFGHEVGDLALISVARVLEVQSAGCCCGRLGGEEFAVTGWLSAAQAQVLAQGIVDAVQQQLVQGQSMSISIGMAQRQGTEPEGSLMRRADKALYQAKHAGKNRYVLAD